MSRKLPGLLAALAAAVLAFAVGYQFPGKEQAAAGETANDRVVKTKTIRCGYILYPPYIEKDLKTGKLQGVSYDLAESIAQTLNMKIEWAKEIPLGGEIPELEKGSVDAVCAITGAYDANTFGQIAFSDYIFIAQNKIYARADDKRFDGPLHLADLDKPDVRFTGIEGDTSFIFPRMLAPHTQMVSLPSLSETAQLFENVKYNKADLLMLENAPAMKALESNPGVFKPLDVRDGLPTYAMQVAFLKKDIALKDTFDEAIRFMKLNGQFEPILGKYDSTGQVLIRAK